VRETLAVGVALRGARLLLPRPAGGESPPRGDGPGEVGSGPCTNEPDSPPGEGTRRAGEDLRRGVPNRIYPNISPRHSGRLGHPRVTIALPLLWSDSALPTGWHLRSCGRRRSRLRGLSDPVSIPIGRSSLWPRLISPAHEGIGDVPFVGISSAARSAAFGIPDSDGSRSRCRGPGEIANREGWCDEIGSRGGRWPSQDQGPMVTAARRGSVRAGPAALNVGK
jgi:hypothetical protein